MVGLDQLMGRRDALLEEMGQRLQETRIGIAAQGSSSRRENGLRAGQQIVLRKAIAGRTLVKGAIRHRRASLHGFVESQPFQQRQESRVEREIRAAIAGLEL